MSVQRYYVVIAEGDWLVISVNPHMLLARFGDVELAKEYAAWKNGQLAAGLTFTNCTFTPPLRPDRSNDRWMPPFHVEKDNEGRERWYVYMHHPTEPLTTTLVETFDGATVQGDAPTRARRYAESMNESYLDDPRGTSLKAVRTADVTAQREAKQRRTVPPVP